jgi:hypothetical protein
MDHAVVKSKHRHLHTGDRHAAFDGAVNQENATRKRDETRLVTVAAESSRSGLPDSKRKPGHNVLSAAVFLAGVIGAAPAMAGSSDSSTAASQKNPVTQESAKVSPGDPTSSPRQVRVERRTPSYWRVTFDHPPFNIFGPETIPQLSEAITAIENDPDLKVVVFDSAVPGFFLTHYDFVRFHGPAFRHDWPSPASRYAGPPGTCANRIDQLDPRTSDRRRERIGSGKRYAFRKP